jgi:hypothetical protein|tara:strand:+ start:1807 stop:2193 length:387 start_codon:yes stop_codon:yes gene_type:complete
MNPFDYVKAINTTKKNIMVDDITESEYQPFLINRSLSYFPDTVLYANEMNQQSHLPARLQFDFFINIIKKRNRFSKWFKPTEIQSIDTVKEYYGYSDEKAKSVLSLLNNSQIEELKKRIYKGGRTKTN